METSTLSVALLGIALRLWPSLSLPVSLPQLLWPPCPAPRVSACPVALLHLGGVGPHFIAHPIRQPLV